MGEIVQTCAALEKILATDPNTQVSKKKRYCYEVLLGQYIGLQLLVDERLEKLQRMQLHDEATNYVDTYKGLYKQLDSANDFSKEDLEQWLNKATESFAKIKQMLTEKNLRRGKKYSLETSMRHFVTIQCLHR